MIPVSQTYNNIIANGGHYEWAVTQIHRTGNTSSSIRLDNHYIIGGTVSSAMYDRLSIGNAIAKEARLRLRIDGAARLYEDPFGLYFTAVGENAYTSEYRYGYFYPDTISTSSYTDIEEVVAYDAMLKADTDFMPTGSYVPISALDLYTTICTDIGVDYDTNTYNLFRDNPYTFSNAPNVGVGGTTDRDMLRYLATIYGGNFIIATYFNSTDRTTRDVLRFIPAYQTSPTDTAVIGDAVTNFEGYDSETVKRVKLWLDHETYYLAPSGYTEEAWLALGGRCIEADLPFYATQAIANNLLTKFENKTFYPYVAPKAYVDPKYEIGDGITVHTENPVTSLIAMQTINIDLLAASQLQFYGEEKVNSLYPYISSVERSTVYMIEQAEEAASQAAAAVGNANYKEQLIYISKASGTTSVAANTTWVTDSSGNQNTWTTKRPVYNSSYPVLFVATQRQSVDQSSGSTCSCTTPMIDQTTTVIDGGHITTGTIDASVVNVTNINASNIETGTLTGVTISGNTISGNTITGGTISGTTITGSTLTSATANGSVRIADGSIDFFKNATTTGSPFSQIKHVYDSGQGDSIEWTNSGYTKLVNTGGGQWTADFLNFKINSSMQMQIYPDSDGYHTNITSDYVYIPGVLRATSDLAWALRQTDVRNDNQAPSWYYSNNAYRTVSEFKQSSVIGLNSGGYYSNLITITPWGDSSGGYPVQYASSNGRLYKRVATSNSAWGAWGRVDNSSVLLASSVGSTEVTVTSAANYYSSFIIVGTPSTNYQASCYIPKAALSSTATKWQVADEARYIGCDVRLNGDTLYAKVTGSTTSGKTVAIYGISGS